MSRRPDYVLKGLDKATEFRSGKIGAAWINRDGSIRVVLDTFTKLESNPNFIYTLFPNDRDENNELPNNLRPRSPQNQGHD